MIATFMRLSAMVSAPIILSLKYLARVGKIL
jgi:hypothetical protein